MKKIAFLALLLISFSYSGICQSQGQMERRFRAESVPKDILNPKYTLIVKIPYNTQHWVEKISNLMQNHYTGSYEVVKFKTSLSEAPYNDTTKYKYVLALGNSLNKMDFVGIKKPTVFNPSGTGSMNIQLVALYMVNRDENLQYYSGLDAQDIMKILGFYADKLSGTK